MATPPQPLNEWFHVTSDEEEIRLDVSPPGAEPWSRRVRWESIVRICFSAEGLELSDGIYLFTSDRAESTVVPTEADGGSELWGAIVKRGLFDFNLAVEAATAETGLFCWPNDDD